MADISFDIAELFERTFGYKSKAFNPEFNHIPGNSSLSPDRKENGAQGSPYYAYDMQGREYFMPVTITYTNSSDDIGLLPGDSTGILYDWDLPYPIISISARKTIVETILTERRGTVKELINMQDYEINVKGFITAKNNEFPENDVTTLRTIYEQNTALSIKCPLTDIFLMRPGRGGSDKIVIRELHFPAVKGIKNVRPYELRMTSDEPFSLISINNS